MSEYLDASIVVKWFKQNEPNHKESIQLLDRIKTFEDDFVMSEYGLLELVRGLVKENFPEQTIESAFEMVKDLYETNALLKVPVEDVLYLAKDIEIKLNLYASDALHLASAIQHGCKIFWSEDKHFFKVKVTDYLSKFNMEARTLVNI